MSETHQPSRPPRRMLEALRVTLRFADLVALGSPTREGRSQRRSGRAGCLRFALTYHRQEFGVEGAGDELREVVGR